MKNYELRQREGRGAMSAVCDRQAVFGRNLQRDHHRGMFLPENKVDNSLKVRKQKNKIVKREKELSYIEKNAKSLPPWLSEAVLNDLGMKR
jgi:ribosomal protein L36